MTREIPYSVCLLIHGSWKHIHIQSISYYSAEWWSEKRCRHKRIRAVACLQFNDNMSYFRDWILLDGCSDREKKRVKNVRREPFVPKKKSSDKIKMSPKWCVLYNIVVSECCVSEWNWRLIFAKLSREPHCIRHGFFLAGYIIFAFTRRSLFSANFYEAHAHTHTHAPSICDTNV